MERKFLYFIAAVIVLILAGGITWSLAGDRLIRAALVPTAKFEALPPPPANAYAEDSGLWYSRPGKGADDPALWVPEGYAASPKPEAALLGLPGRTQIVGRRMPIPSKIPRRE